MNDSDNSETSEDSDHRRQRHRVNRNRLRPFYVNRKDILTLFDDEKLRKTFRLLASIPIGRSFFSFGCNILKRGLGAAVAAPQLPNASLAILVALTRTSISTATNSY